MANAREIQSRIKSIQDTRKITSAMYMISSTKLKKSKKMLEETEPYFYTLQMLIRRVLRHLPPDVDHKFFSRRESVVGDDRTHGLIVVTGDKGLAGAYNHNVLKMAEAWMGEHKNHKLYVVGELGRQYFGAKNIHVEEQFHYTVQNPSMHRARMISTRVQIDYEKGLLDEVWILYTRMINSMTMVAEIIDLLPLKREKFQFEIPTDIMKEDIQMYPTPEAIMDNIVPNYLTGFVYGALVESFCSEQDARMMAMQSASDNANKILGELSIEYNRVRQAAITQEITEVISGAKAQKKKHK